MSFGVRNRWRCFLGMTMSGAIAFSTNAAFAQITPDKTLPNNSTVRPDGSTHIIEGGTRAGGNLFHSFSEFSVPNKQTAHFNNGADVQNIFSRVTGSTVSNIDGTLRANGTANLFLINPYGIIFGKNARLNIGGSFVASTASSLKFASGFEFSTLAPQTTPLLTVSVPIGLQFGTNPGSILNQSQATDSSDETIGLQVQPGKTLALVEGNVYSDGGGLQVQPGKTLALVGGNISSDGGYLHAPSGRVELGGVAEPSIVGLNVDSNDLRFHFPDGAARADVSLTNSAGVDVIGAGGNISINARNLNISGSKLLAGVWSELGLIGTTGGDIKLDAAKSVKIDDSSVFNYVAAQTVGNSGDINIKATSLELRNAAQIGTITYGNGDAGSVLIQAKDSVSLAGIGTSILSNVTSFRNVAFCGSDCSAIGNSGGISIQARSFSLTDGAQLIASTFGTGNAGSVFVKADDSISLVGVDTAVFNTVGFDFQGAVGNSKGITFKAKSLFLADGARLIASTFGTGNAGSISLQIDGSISLLGNSIGESQFQTAPVNLPGDLPRGKNLPLPSNLSKNIVSTGIFSTVESKAQGNAGGIQIQSQSLSLTNGSEVQSLTRGQGNAGNIQINALNVVDISNFAQPQVAQSDKDVILGGFSSGVISSTEGEASGIGGNIELTTNSLRLSHGAVLNARTRSASNGGNITVNTNTLELTNGGQILTSAFNSGNAGNITVNPTDRVSISGSDSTFATRLEQFGEATVDNDGSNSGLFARVRGDTSANAGKIQVTARDLRLDKLGTITTETTLGEGGDIILSVGDILLLRNNSIITATAGTADAGGNGGNITITAPDGFIVAALNENSDIAANAYTGTGGKVQINAAGVFGLTPRSRDDLVRLLGTNDATQLNPQKLITNDITAISQTSPDLSGTININTLDIDPNRGLINLPTVPLETKVSQVCQPRIAENQSSFIVTGRGGLPPNPRTETLSSDAVQLDWVTLKPKVENLNRINLSKPTSAKSAPIVEATGWIKNALGEVELTADASTTPRSSTAKPVLCHAS